MNIKRNLRKLTELGIGLTAVATLALAGCGGGGSGGGSSGGGSSGSGSGSGTVTPVTSGSTVTVGTGGSTSSAQGYIDQLTGAGLRSVVSSGTPASGVTPATATTVGILTATNNGNGTYTPASAHKTLTNGAWVAASPTTSTTSVYFLNGTSWVADNGTQVPTFSPNADGSVALSGALWNENLTYTPVDLSGVNMRTGATLQVNFSGGASTVVSVGAMGTSATIVDSNGSVVNTAIPATSYPAGSVAWVQTSNVATQDQYQAYVSTFYMATTPTAPVTTLLFANANTYTLTNPLCVGSYELVYTKPQPTGLAANTARFDVFLTGTCTANPTTKYGTVDFTYATGPSQTIALPSNYIPVTPGYSSLFSLTTSGGTMVEFLAPINGGVYWGIKIPVGYQFGSARPLSTSLNKTAMDAVMTAVNLPKF